MWTSRLSGWNITWKQRVTNLPAGVDFAYDCEIVQENPGVTLGFTLQCDGAFIQPPAGTVIKYRPHNPANNCTGNTGWSTLFSFTNENVGTTSHTFTELVDGDYYDFRAIAAGKQVDTCNVEIIDNHIYNVIPPASVCNAIGL